MSKLTIKLNTIFGNFLLTEDYVINLQAQSFIVQDFSEEKRYDACKTFFLIFFEQIFLLILTIALMWINWFGW